MKTKLVAESLQENNQLNEKWFKGRGSDLTIALNLAMFFGSLPAFAIAKLSNNLAWGITSIILYGAGALGVLGLASGDLDYFEWINDLEDWVKSRKYKTAEGRKELDDKIDEVKEFVANNPKLGRGQKANITRIKNAIKRGIERKDWVSVRYNLQYLEKTIKGYDVDTENPNMNNM